MLAAATTIRSGWTSPACATWLTTRYTRRLASNPISVAQRTITSSRRCIVWLRSYSRRMRADSVITSGLLEVPSTGRKSGTTVVKLMVTEASTRESGLHPVMPGGGDVAGVQVTETLAGVMLAAVRMSLMRATAELLSNTVFVEVDPDPGALTTPTRAPSRAAFIATLAVSQARLSSSPP